MAYQFKPIQRPKYGNKKIIVNGETFDSQKEARRNTTLRQMEQLGMITGLRRQVRFELVPAQKDPETGKVIERAIDYVADFCYQDADGKTVVEDVKGYRNTADAAYRIFVIKRKLMRWIHGIEIREL